MNGLVIGLLCPAQHLRWTQWMESVVQVEGGVSGSSVRRVVDCCGRSQKCVRASRQLAAPLALRCNVRCTFVDDRPVCGYGRSLRRCLCAAARASVADRSAGARGTEFTTRTDLQSQTGTSGPKWSENQGARMFNNNLGVSHYISPMPDDAALSRAADPCASLIPRHCNCPSVRMDSSTSSRHECASALTVLPLSTRLPMYCTKYWRGPSTKMSPATCRDSMTQMGGHLHHSYSPPWESFDLKATVSSRRGFFWSIFIQILLQGIFIREIRLGDPAHLLHWLVPPEHQVFFCPSPSLSDPTPP